MGGSLSPVFEPAAFAVRRVSVGVVVRYECQEAGKLFALLLGDLLLVQGREVAQMQSVAWPQTRSSWTTDKHRTVFYVS